MATARRARRAGRRARRPDACRRCTHRALVRAAMTLGTATPPRRARGAAIVIAMLLAALAAAVTVALAAGQERWRATVEHRRDQVQAEALAQAGVQWSLGVLDQAARDSPVDALTEPWALPLPPTPIGNGSIEGRIVDAQGFLNVNNLAVAGNAADVERLRLRALFTAVGAAGAARTHRRARDDPRNHAGDDARDRALGRRAAAADDAQCQHRAARGAAGGATRARRRRDNRARRRPHAQAVLDDRRIPCTAAGFGARR